ncbi:AAA family ATPase [Oceanobacillus chungangensis]|uniref:ATPase n=1 Tax=Oceanobacillus chungangensis TaxID=1229152 RepID=A0A3D8PJL8_9BACI|nr:MoxR family ATPase [Oceanobacillus chungangensis]RDW15385.1 ATPase [Oceanobacillus chungangensis]
MNEQMRSLDKIFRENGYITDKPTLIALKLVQALKKPLLLEGPAGVGKTEIAKVLAKSLDTKLIRLQCYEGLDVHSALYEWNYAKQMLHIRLTENTELTVDERESTIYGKDFLLSRPLLQAFTESEAAPVLLIDEIDRADEAFEAFLLEALAEFQITIPEIGTIKAKQQPYIILTSNRTRELSDALRRRCLYQWVPFPDYKKEVSILQTRIPELNQNLTEQIAKFMESIRQIPLQKVPGVAESLDWARALIELHQSELNQDTVRETLGCFLKNHDDWDKIEKELNQGTLLHSNG